MEFCRSGWPNRHSIPAAVKAYWKARNSLSIHNNLLLFNSRVVVPPPLQENVLERIHEGHQGISRCQMLTKASVWWPGISSAVQEMIQQCQVCARDAEPTQKLLIPRPLPDYPWQVVGSDLFELHGIQYLLVVDHFSSYPEVVGLSYTPSNAVISALRPMFARHGIPEVLRSDNGPQYASEEFEKFANTYEFSHNTTSPHFPQSNGLVERMVETVKQLLQHSSDLNLALLTYRSTPLPW